MVAREDDPTVQDELTKTFVERVAEQMPYGKVGFCGFCQDYGEWSPEAEFPPHFFGALWLTCLVAQGYPDPREDFHSRMGRLFDRTVNLSCLPELWADLAAWTEHLVADGRISVGSLAYKRLELPDKDDFRTIIGNSWFLAFPHYRDRRTLHQLLRESDRDGEEPGILDMVELLRSAATRFSNTFRRELESFVGEYRRGKEPRESYFWRAVRREVFSASQWAIDTTESSPIEVWGKFDDFDFRPYIVCSDESLDLPDGFSTYSLGEQPLESPEYAWYIGTEIEDASEAIDQAVSRAFAGELGIATEVHRQAHRGVLVFSEDEEGTHHRLVRGSGANGAEIALVRAHLVESFLQAYGGEAEDSRFEGWHQVLGCEVTVRSELPPGLEAVRHLQETMFPPTVRLVGGIHTAEGFYATRGYLPMVRFYGAEDIRVYDDEENPIGTATKRLPTESAWELPPSLVDKAPGRFLIRVFWRDFIGSLHASERWVKFVLEHLNIRYKTLGSGYYYVESALPGELEIKGRDDIPLVIQVRVIGGSEDATRDFSCYEQDIRYLGPGIGEFSSTRTPDFDWLVSGPRNNPSQLLFVGDPLSPTERAQRRATNDGLRRFWNQAVKCSLVKVATDSGPKHLEEFPEVRQTLDDYRDRASAPPSNAPNIAPELDDYSGPPPKRGVEPHSSADLLVDILSARATRQSGMRYQSVLEAFDFAFGWDGTMGLHARQDLTRAWVEAGVFDIAYRQGRKATYVCARKPRFVMRRVGALVRASLIGLVPKAVEDVVSRGATGKGIRCEYTLPPCRWMPRVLGTEHHDPEVLRDLSMELGLEVPYWLHLPKEAELDPEANMARPWDTPPFSSTLESRWHPVDGRFSSISRGEASSEVDDMVCVDKYTHAERTPVYAPFSDGGYWGWTYIRNWALLLAQHLSGGSGGFSLDDSEGTIERTVPGELYLPLPVGRLCAVVGRGLAGPIVDSDGSMKGGYEYPLGNGYIRALADHLPLTHLDVPVEQTPG